MKAYELLISTAMYYGADTSRRAIIPDSKGTGGTCFYGDDKMPGKHCAIGRWMTEDQWREASRSNPCASDLDEDDVPVCLETIELPHLERIQNFHDVTAYWNVDAGRGLTSAGRRLFQKLAKEFRLPE